MSTLHCQPKSSPNCVAVPTPPREIWRGSTRMRRPRSCGQICAGQQRNGRRIQTKPKIDQNPAGHARHNHAGNALIAAYHVDESDFDFGEDCFPSFAQFPKSASHRFDAREKKTELVEGGRFSDGRRRIANPDMDLVRDDLPPRHVVKRTRCDQLLQVDLHGSPRRAPTRRLRRN